LAVDTHARPLLFGPIITIYRRHVKAHFSYNVGTRTSAQKVYINGIPAILGALGVVLSFMTIADAVLQAADVRRASDQPYIGREVKSAFRFATPIIEGGQYRSSAD
jgi:hypothetical protein